MLIPRLLLLYHKFLKIDGQVLMQVENGFLGIVVKVPIAWPMLHECVVGERGRPLMKITARSGW